MTATTNPNFNENTDGLEVAKAYSESIRGKTIIVTGVNLKGIGFSTAQAFASQAPAHLIIAGRTKSKLQECLDTIKKEYPDVDCRTLILDLGSQKAVRTAAQELLSWKDVPTVDILVSSAGIAGIPERTLSEEGIEITFATNHVGHFLFTNLILPKMIEAAKINPKGLHASSTSVLAQRKLTGSVGATSTSKRSRLTCPKKNSPTIWCLACGESRMAKICPTLDWRRTFKARLQTYSSVSPLQRECTRSTGF